MFDIKLHKTLIFNRKQTTKGDYVPKYKSVMFIVLFVRSSLLQAYAGDTGVQTQVTGYET
jgi:hypothetical protein